MTQRQTGREAGFAAALVALFLALGGWALLCDASVADEHPHVLAGWLYWKCGRFSGGFDNPPLGQLLVAAPMHLGGRAYRFPADEHLWMCRLPVLSCAVLLALVLWRWGRSLWPAAGVAALAAMCLEPNLLAHGHLATLDFTHTVLWWLVLWAWRGVLLERTAGRWHATLVVLGLAAASLTKFTGLLLWPALALTLPLARREARRRALVLLGVGLLATWAAAHAAYGFGPVAWGLPATLADGLRGKLEHRDEVRFAYLLGRRSDSGFLAYYLVGLAVKTPLPLLMLAGWGAVALGRERRRFEVALLAVPALLLVAAFSLIRVNVGVRHVLPVYPALVLAAACGAADLARRTRRIRLALAALGALWVGGVLCVAPRWLGYFNVLAGGEAGGHRVLLDSNLDWGQDDARLAAAQERLPPGTAVCPDPQLPVTGRFLVNANSLHNLQRTSARPYAWLRTLAPRARIGSAWWLYDLDLEDFARAARDHPQDPGAAWGHAAALAGAGRLAEAAEVRRAAMARLTDPRSRREYAAVSAQDAARRERWEEGVAWADSGLASAPGDPELAAVRAWLDLERRRAASPPGSAARARIALALGMLRGERAELDRALALLEEAADGLPAEVEAQRALGVARARAGDWEGALRVFSRRDLATELVSERELVVALAATERALVAGGPVGSLDPDLLLELGRLHFEAGHADAAARAFLAGVARRPDDPDALGYLGEVFVRSKLRILPERIVPRPIPIGRP